MTFLLVRDTWRCDDCAVQWSSISGQPDDCWMCGNPPTAQGRYVYNAATITPQGDEESPI